MTSSGNDFNVCVNTTIVLKSLMVAFFVSDAEYALDIFLSFLKWQNFHNQNCSSEDNFLDSVNKFDRLYMTVFIYLKFKRSKYRIKLKIFIHWHIQGVVSMVGTPPLIFSIIFFLKIM